MCNHQNRFYKSCSNNGNFNTNVSKIDRLRGFFIHLLTYGLVNAGLIIINLLTNPTHLWFIWPLVGWGIGIVSDAASTPGLRWVLTGREKPTFLQG